MRGVQWEISILFSFPAWDEKQFEAFDQQRIGTVSSVPFPYSYLFQRQCARCVFGFQRDNRRRKQNTLAITAPTAADGTGAEFFGYEETHFTDGKLAICN